MIWAGGGSAAAEAKKQDPTATRSSPIAITHSDGYVWSVNPDNDSVSVFNVTDDQNTKVAEINVGKEPWCVAITPDDEKVYVTNMASGTVSVISTISKEVIHTIKVGTEPFGCALTPDGRKLYVANQSSDTVSVIDTRRDRVIETIGHVGIKPHGIAITRRRRQVLVTQFLALKPDDDPRPLTQSEGADDGREGRVTVINAHNDHVIGRGPSCAARRCWSGLQIGRQYAGARAAHHCLRQCVGRVSEPARVHHHQRQPRLRSRHLLLAERPVSLQRQRAELPLHDRHRAEYSRRSTTLNMNVGVNFEPVGKKLFNTNPFSVAFKRSSGEGFIALAATNRLLRVTLE